MIKKTVLRGFLNLQAVSLDVDTIFCSSLFPFFPCLNFVYYLFLSVSETWEDTGFYPEGGGGLCLGVQIKDYEEQNKKINNLQTYCFFM